MLSIKLQIVALAILAVVQYPAAAESFPRTDLFGDPLPPGALARMGTIRYARGDSTMGSPVLAPDHKTFVTVSRITPFGTGQVVCLWDAVTGKEMRHFDAADFEPYEVFFLKTENLLGAFGVSRKPGREGEDVYSIRYWNVASGKKTDSSIDTPASPMTHWALSPDERYFVDVTQGPPVVWERKTGKVMAKWKGTENGIFSPTFSPDGKTVAFCCGNLFSPLGLEGGGKARELADFPDGTLFGSGFLQTADGSSATFITKAYTSGKWKV